MRSSVAQHETFGVLMLITGVVLGLFDREGLWNTVGLGVAMAIAFYAALYWFELRRFAPVELDWGEVEPVARTRMRVLVRVLVLIVVFTIATLLPGDSGGGVAIGFGLCGLATSLRLRRWERAHGKRVLTKPKSGERFYALTA